MNSRRSFLRKSGLMMAGLTMLHAPDKMLALQVDQGLPKTDDPDYWHKLRDFFPMPKEEAYLNTGTIGATPSPVLQAITKHLEEYAQNIARVDWSNGGIDIITGYFPHDSLRKKLAQLMNTEHQNLALTKNAHMGMNLVAHGLSLKSGDEVIQTNLEHSGGKSGWEVLAKRVGIKIKQINIAPPIKNPEYIYDLVAAQINPKTKVIAIPHILSVPGDIMPIKEICRLARSKGIMTVIDGAQAIGHIGIDVQDLDCDAYFASPHKWLLAPAGSGVLYLHPEFAPKLETCMPSGAWDDHKDEGFRFTQRGTDNSAMMIGYEAALDFHNLIGHDRIVKRIKYLGDYLRSKLQEYEIFDIHSSLHPEMCAGLTTYGVKGISGKDLQTAMWQQEKLQPRPVGPDQAYIRFSTHIYNSTEEIDRAVKVAQRLVK